MSDTPETDAVWSCMPGYATIEHARKMERERNLLRRALVVMNEHVHCISGYDWNADPDKVTLLVGQALSSTAPSPKPETVHPEMGEQ